MSDLVKKDLDRRIEKGQVDKNLAAVLLLSNSDTLTTIVQAAMGRDAAVSQAENAQSQTKTNLDGLSSLFGSQILDSIQNESNPSLLAKACARAALLPGAPMVAKKDISQKCAGTVWTSVHPHLRISFDEIIKKPFDERACSVYDFYRKSTLLDMGERAGFSK